MEYSTNKRAEIHMILGSHHGEVNGNSYSIVLSQLVFSKAKATCIYSHKNRSQLYRIRTHIRHLLLFHSRALSSLYSCRSLSLSLSHWRLFCSSTALEATADGLVRVHSNYRLVTGYTSMTKMTPVMAMYSALEMTIWRWPESAVTTLWRNGHCVVN